MENLGSNQDTEHTAPLPTLTQEFVEAWCKAQLNIDHAYKDKTGQYGGHASIESIISAVKTSFCKQNIMYFQHQKPHDKGVMIQTSFYGHGSELHSGWFFIPAENLSPQKFGGALTYARKYSLSNACGIGSDDDDAQAIQDDYENKEAKPNGKIWYADLPYEKFIINPKDLDKITQVKSQKEIASWLSMTDLKKAEEFAKTMTIQSEKLKPVYSTIRTSINNYFAEV